MVGCNGTQPTIVPVPTEGTYGISPNLHTIQEITHDGCQYIGHFQGGKDDWGTHKGNCTNPLHTPVKICGDSITFMTAKQVK